MDLLYIFLICFLTVYFSTFFFRALALKFNILDAPGSRKIHKSHTPLLGGLAIYIGVIVGLLLHFQDLRFLYGIIIGATLILIIGLVDDIRGLSAQLRLLGQVAAALILIGFGIRLSFLPNTEWGNLGEIALTVIWVVGITNALNYLDGLDGLATGLAAISAFFFSMIAFQTDQFSIGLIGFLIVASCLGFLPHNFRNARIFLGDAGSTFIGFVLAGMAMVGNWAEDNVIKLTVPLLILGIPIFDMIFTTVMRIKEKKIRTVIEWLKYTGRDHFHHRLMDLGLYPTGVIFFIYFLNVSLGISAIMVSNEKALVGVLATFQAAIIFIGAAVLMIIGKRQHDE